MRKKDPCLFRTSLYGGVEWETRMGHALCLRDGLSSRTTEARPAVSREEEVLLWREARKRS